MIWLLALPILVPFATGILAFFARASRAGGLISLAGSALSLFLATLLLRKAMAQGVAAGQMSGWPAPFGITLVADHLSAAMVMISAVIGLAIALYSLSEIGPSTQRSGYYLLVQTLLGGVNGAFLTGDIFNLYVWFEVMLISSFGLLVISGRARAIDAGVKYVTLNLVSTAMFLCGAGLLYGAAGTLNMADLHGAVAAQAGEGRILVIAVLFLFAFGVKAALFPLFFWLPASYHTPHFAVSALFAGLLTKVGVYALIRSFTLIFPAGTGFIHDLLLWLAVATMITGVLGAAAQSEFRKILSFHIISQIGYMVLGLALMTPLALVGAIFYLIHHIIVKANLFLIAGLSHRITGSSDLARIGGLYRGAPLLAALFLIPALSLAGIPPLSGFWAKFLILRAALDQQMWLVAGASLAVGLLTVYSMTKIWAEAFWMDHPTGLSPSLGRIPAKGRWLALSPVIGLAALTVVIGLFPEPFIQYGVTAAQQLLDPQAYIAAVLTQPGTP